jgi:hypothetical protein
MLDTFEILTTSGVVLWSRTYAPVGANIVNSLIRDVFIEERILPQPEDAGSKPTYKKEGYTLKWTASKDVGLIFVVRSLCRDILERHQQLCRDICATPEQLLTGCAGGIPEPSSPYMDRQASRQCARPLRGPLRRPIEGGAHQRGQL